MFPSNNTNLKTRHVIANTKKYLIRFDNNLQWFKSRPITLHKLAIKTAAKSKVLGSLVYVSNLMQTAIPVATNLTLLILSYDLFPRTLCLFCKSS